MPSFWYPHDSEGRGGSRGREGGLRNNAPKTPRIITPVTEYYVARLSHALQASV
jgi:hypothetical protein